MPRPTPEVNDVELNPRQREHRFELIVDHPLMNLRTHSFFHTKESVLRSYHMCHSPEEARIRVLEGVRDQERGR